MRTQLLFVFAMLAGTSFAKEFAVPQGGETLRTIALVECLADDGTRGAGQYCRTTYTCAGRDGRYTSGTLWEGLTYADGRRVTLESDQIAFERECVLTVEDSAEVSFYTGYRGRGGQGVVGFVRSVGSRNSAVVGSEGGCLATSENACRDSMHLPEAECERESPGWGVIRLDADLNEGAEILFHGGVPEGTVLLFDTGVAGLQRQLGDTYAFWSAELGLFESFDSGALTKRYDANLTYAAPTVVEDVRETLKATVRYEGGACVSTTLSFWIVDTD